MCRYRSGRLNIVNCNVLQFIVSDVAAAWMHGHFTKKISPYQDFTGFRKVLNVISNTSATFYATSFGQRCIIYDSAFGNLVPDPLYCFLVSSDSVVFRIETNLTFFRFTVASIAAEPVQCSFRFLITTWQEHRDNPGVLVGHGSLQLVMQPFQAGCLFRLAKKNRR